MLKNNLEAGLLSELFILFRDHALSAGDDLVPMLNALTTVPRFDTAVMFLDDAVILETTTRVWWGER